MTTDLERTVRHAHKAQKTKSRTMQEFERDRAPKGSTRLAQNLRIEKDALQQKDKARKAFSR